MKLRYITLVTVVVLATIALSVTVLNFALSYENRIDSPTDGNKQNDFEAVYDYYGGVGLFNQGIHVIATSHDPLILADEFQIANDYWRLLEGNETTKASSKDFISIILSRGDHPTGGYTIQIKSFSWLESYPVIFRFQVNLTDPGDGVAVTEALTNPLVLTPIGRLSPGEYVVEVHIAQYILTYDEQGSPIYTPVMTFREEVWKQTFTVQ